MNPQGFRERRLWQSRFFHTFLLSRSCRPFEDPAREAAFPRYCPFFFEESAPEEVSFSWPSFFSRELISDGS